MFPEDLRYTDKHEWLRAGNESIVRVGITEFAAEALGDVSAHLTVGIHTVTRYALVEALTGLAVADPELRRSLPLGVDVASA